MENALGLGFGYWPQAAPHREPEEEGVAEIPSVLDELDDRIEGFNPGTVHPTFGETPHIRIDTNVPHYMVDTYYPNTLTTPSTPYMGAPSSFSPTSNGGSSPAKSTPRTPASTHGAPLQAYAGYYPSSSPPSGHSVDSSYGYYPMNTVKQESEASSYPSTGQQYLALPPQHSPTASRNHPSYSYSPSSMGSGSSFQSPASRTMSMSPVIPRHGGLPYPSDIAPGRGRMIPQSKYRPHTAADRDRYVNKITLHDPVNFNTTNPGVIGIALTDAIAGKYQQLDGRDDRLFLQCGPSISIRINWAGCYPPWSRQIPTRDFKNPPGPVTRSKVAKNVARSVQRFIDEMNTKQIEEDADPSWAVGRARGGILLEDLALIRLEHVSKGSWQAHLCFVNANVNKGPNY